MCGLYVQHALKENERLLLEREAQEIAVRDVSLLCSPSLFIFHLSFSPLQSGMGWCLPLYLSVSLYVSFNFLSVCPSVSLIVTLSPSLCFSLLSHSISLSQASRPPPILLSHDNDLPMCSTTLHAPTPSLYDSVAWYGHVSDLIRLSNSRILLECVV